VVATWAGYTGARAGEVGMQGVYGTPMARDMTVPFVNALPWSGSSLDCGVGTGAPQRKGSGEGGGDQGGGEDGGD